MGSLIMSPLFDEIKFTFDQSQITVLFVVDLLIVIIQLILSVSLCPKLITLSSFHCMKIGKESSSALIV